MNSKAITIHPSEPVHFAKEVEAIQAKIEPILISDSASLEQLEKSIRTQTDQLAALLLQQKLQAHLNSLEAQQSERELAHNLSPKLRKEEYVEVRLSTSTGFPIVVKTAYYRQNCHRKAGKRHKGAYPALILLGIHERVSPLLAAQVGMWCGLLGSFDEVRQVLQEQGVDISVNKLRSISYAYAQRARQYQEQHSIAELLEGNNVTGRRVVVSTDGGRTRLRENKRGPKTDKGRTRFHGNWREPKLLIIYVVDENGKQDRHFAPIIDGCMQGPDAIFKRIRCYLEALKIEAADHLLFVADGAHWIWNRVEELIKTLNMDASQIHQLVDFYHAIEHINKVSQFKKGWDDAERRKWQKTQRHHLLSGKVDCVIQAIHEICKGRLSKDIKTEKNYFDRNKGRMNYAAIKTLNLPIGSGAIESSVRRVINLRIKGPCTFWLKNNAEHILMLRAFFKAGRWKLLNKMANSVKNLVFL